MMQSEEHKGLHVAIIMDGNGRWATRRGLPRVAGHRAGAASVRRVVEHALKLGIARLTLYAFSCDNWSRPAPEVQSIFWLMRAFLRLEARRLQQRGVKLHVIGRRDRLGGAVLKEIQRAEAMTAAEVNLDLYIAIDYSSRDAIMRAAVDATYSFAAEGSHSADLFRSLLTRTLSRNGSEVDLLIRTGGEKRLSDFLLWESAYAELLFTDRMWPEFDEADLEAALREFKQRERRFGAVTNSAQHALAGA